MNLSEEAAFDNRVNTGIHAAGILEFLSELILAVRSESLREREGFQVAGELVLHNKSVQQAFPVPATLMGSISSIQSRSRFTESIWQLPFAKTLFAFEINRLDD